MNLKRLRAAALDLPWGRRPLVLALRSVGHTGALLHPVGSACGSRRALLCYW